MRIFEPQIWQFQKKVVILQTDYKRMHTYLFYTSEGYTEAPDLSAVENCQILGVVQSDTEETARTRLIEENPWISEHGYSIELISAYHICDI